MPALTSLNADWASCMADSNYPGVSDPDGASELLSDHIRDAGIDSKKGPTPEQRAELRDYEIDLALADFRCSKKLDYQQKSLAVQFAAEKKFVSENKAELDQMLAAVNQGN